MENKKILITGGAGFIGISSANYFLKNGYDVTIFDDFSRRGTRLNIEWLSSVFQDKFKIIKADIVRDKNILTHAVADNDIVLHLAAQVAVTSSVVDPITDFQINAVGTFNVLEAIRLSKNRPILIYASTNKVYGSLSNIKVMEREKRYDFVDKPFGISENQNLDFHSPYGCSKGAADQYVNDYGRIYGIKTVVLRQSCIYGHHQFGVEDQGWVAWFLIAALLNKNITIYGDGKQVRDLLFIDDLVKLYNIIIKNINCAKGKTYNVGGGVNNTMSLLEFIPILEEKMNIKINPTYSEIRQGDQPIFIADIRKVKKDLGWEPEYSISRGLDVMVKWVKDNKDKLRLINEKN